MKEAHGGGHAEIRKSPEGDRVDRVTFTTTTTTENTREGTRFDKAVTSLMIHVRTTIN